MKAAGLKYCVMRPSGLPERQGLTPGTIVGRCVLLPYEVRLLVCVIANGPPFWITVMSWNFQPPTARSSQRFAAPRNCLPWPNGSSYVPASEKRLGMSLVARAYSDDRL